MRVLGRDDVRAALDGREGAVLDAVRNAYLLHRAGQSEIPFSSFLRPPGRPGSRIICLPAYLGGTDPVIGVKWISSFPTNLERGLQRASAVSILNDLETGYPVAVLESSQISAARTAAGAAVASEVLHGGTAVRTVGLIGCGTINHRTLAYLTRVHPGIREVALFDAVDEHAKLAAERWAEQFPGIDLTPGDLTSALRAQTVSIATTDSSYWLSLGDHPDRPPDQVVLHLSLRDLDVASILRGYNVVDDVDHVCREQTSLHRTELELGHRGFIHATIGGLLSGDPIAKPTSANTIFSPFGLGVLDLAVSVEVVRAAEAGGTGITVDGFEPGSHQITSQLTGGKA
ncbi:2,3-diaminopropionate biosynthesis protein SbnB [Micromonospora rifamycinica]|uniref:2,3-diaminopropionate biosynthesis protein SbnB n=1 Tax=Micromonospora TaxID=1873 RepID=UPI002E241F30